MRSHLGRPDAPSLSTCGRFDRDDRIVDVMAEVSCISCINLVNWRRDKLRDQERRVWRKRKFR